MIHQSPHIAVHLLQHKLIRFGLIGGVATIIHALIFLAITSSGGLQILANCAGYALASIWSYVLNSSWTFAAALSWAAFVRFQIANSIVLVWSVISALIGEAVSLEPTWTLVLTVLFGPVMNYLGHRYFTFRDA